MEAPQQRTREEISTSKVSEDIRTSQLTPRLAGDGDHVREYPAVVHDRPIREYPAMSNGERFGTNILPESISVSCENARWYLAFVYGMDTADGMIGRAFATQQLIEGDKFTVTDGQARTKGKLSVATDKSRPGFLVIVPHVLRQTGGAKKCDTTSKTKKATGPNTSS
jgi:hypothetical protein